jgi:hypothetical protein
VLLTCDADGSHGAKQQAGVDTGLISDLMQHWQLFSKNATAVGNLHV